MRNYILIVMAIALSLEVNAQVSRDAEGNFLSKARVQAAHDSTTTYTYTDGKGKVEPVFTGRKGGYYLARISKKSGKFYRKYLKLED
tara:strand:- start:1011 stop:1271 length:261 start_codon:yes stop_codon:yes gene_type:complete